MSVANGPSDKLGNRLGFTFHRTFFLKRSAIKQVLELVESGSNQKGEKSKLLRRDIRDNSQLGTIYVEAMPRWAWGIGLLTPTKAFTKFGKYAQVYDISMEQLGTQWLMHYHLSAPHGPGPSFWHKVVSSQLRSGENLSQEKIAHQISEIYLHEEGKPLSPKSATSTANVFIETYIQKEALGNLGILEEIEKNCYQVQETEIPPTWAVAAAILDYWQAHFPNQVTINLTSLTTDSGLASLFMISRSRLDMILSEMREAGIVELFRVAPPYQVALLNGDPEPIFERMYQHEHSA